MWYSVQTHKLGQCYAQETQYRKKNNATLKMEPAAYIPPKRR